MKICNPAKVYLGISILFILIGFVSQTISVYALLLKALFVLLWTYVLSILCKKRMKELAWAFVLLPFIMMGSSIMYGSYREGAENAVLYDVALPTKTLEDRFRITGKNELKGKNERCSVWRECQSKKCTKPDYNVCV